jgi:hypothetical protein
MINKIYIQAIKILNSEFRILFNLLVVITIHLIMSGSVVAYNMVGDEISPETQIENNVNKENKLTASLLFVSSITLWFFFILGSGTVDGSIFEQILEAFLNVNDTASTTSEILSSNEVETGTDSDSGSNKTKEEEINFAIEGPSPVKIENVIEETKPLEEPKLDIFSRNNPEMMKYLDNYTFNDMVVHHVPDKCDFYNPEDRAKLNADLSDFHERLIENMLKKKPNPEAFVDEKRYKLGLTFTQKCFERPELREKYTMMFLDNYPESGALLDKYRENFGPKNL